MHPPLEQLVAGLTCVTCVFCIWYLVILYFYFYLYLNLYIVSQSNPLSVVDPVLQAHLVFRIWYLPGRARQTMCGVMFESVFSSSPSVCVRTITAYLRYVHQHSLCVSCGAIRMTWMFLLFLLHGVLMMTRGTQARGIIPDSHFNGRSRPRPWREFAGGT